MAAIGGVKQHRIETASMRKLTKRTVDSAAVKKSDYFVWDEVQPGFALRILPSGGKRYIVQYSAATRNGDNPLTLWDPALHCGRITP